MTRSLAFLNSKVYQTTISDDRVQNEQTKINIDSKWAIKLYRGLYYSLNRKIKKRN